MWFLGLMADLILQVMGSVSGRWGWWVLLVLIGVGIWLTVK
jgi:hypothetical protein